MVENDNHSLYKLNIVHDGSTGISQLNWSTIWHYLLRGQHSGIKCLLKVQDCRKQVAMITDTLSRVGKP